MTQQYFQVIAHYRARQGNGDAVEARLHDLARASRKEAGNISYAFFRSPEDQNHFVILEQYTSEAAFADHRTSDHFQRIGVGEIIPMLESREVTSFYAPAQKT